MAISILEDYVRQLETIPPEIEESPAPEAPSYLFGNQRTLTRCAPPPPTKQQWFDLDFFRRTIEKEMKAYFLTPDPDYMLLIPSPPGSGKSTAGVKFAHWVADRTGRRVFYAGPRHDFFIDLQKTATEHSLDPNIWLEWMPRQKDDERPHRHTCHWADEIRTWLQKGYDGMDFCRQVCGFDYLNDECKYNKQKDKPHPIIYGQHAHIFTAHPLTSQFAAVIGDELPLGSVINEWLVPPGGILLRDLDPQEPMAELIARIAVLVDRKERVSGPTLLAALGGAGSVLDTIAGFGLPADADILAPRLHRGSGREAADVPTNYLPTFLGLLAQEAEAAQESDKYIERIYVDELGLKLLSRNQVNEEFSQKHMIWFDATGTADLYEAIFDRKVRKIDAQPQIAGRIYQVTDRSNGKSSLMRYDEKSGEHNPTGKVEQIAAQIFHIIEKEQANNYAVGTFQKVLDVLGLPGIHFYGGRGTNAFETSDVFIVAGTPMPPLWQIEKFAKCLWPTRMTPFDTAFILEDRTYNYVDPDDGQGWSYPASVFADPALNILLWQFREAEIIQIAHRSRMLTRPGAVVYLLTNVPIDALPPTRLLSIADLMDAPQGVNVFTWADTRKKLETYTAEHGPMTIKQICEIADVSHPTALKYRDILTEKYGWGIAPVDREPGKRGKAPSGYLPPC